MRSINYPERITFRASSKEKEILQKAIDKGIADAKRAVHITVSVK